MEAVNVAVPSPSKKRRKRRRLRGYSMWRERRKDGVEGWVAYIGKKTTGTEALKKWCGSRAAASKWLKAQLKHFKQLGATEWQPTRAQLIEYEQIDQLLKQAAAEGLKLSPLLDLVKKTVVDARADRTRKSTLGMDCLAEWEKENRDDLSWEHVRHVLWVCRCFFSWFGTQRPMDEVTFQDAKRWVDQLHVSRKTKKKYADVLKALWNWAAHPSLGYVVSNPWAMFRYKRFRKPKPGILTIEEVASLLRIAAAEPGQPMLPFLVIALYAGPRVAECERLKWADVTLNGGRPGIQLSAEITKLQEPRWVDLPEVAVKWLELYSGPRDGLIAPSSIKFRRARLQAQAGFVLKARRSNNAKDIVEPLDGVSRRPWPRNALRHTFCTYALAHTRDEVEVAFCAGHDRETLRRDYDGGATPMTAGMYYDLWPEKVIRPGSILISSTNASKCA